MKPRFGKALRFPRARDEPKHSPTESEIYSGCGFLLYQFVEMEIY